MPWDMPCHPATDTGDFPEEVEYKLRPEAGQMWGGEVTGNGHFRKWDWQVQRPRGERTVTDM